MEKLLSLCMIGRNTAKYLDRCLSSCFSLFDEICYVDNQSTDNSIDIAKKYDAVIGEYHNTLPGAETWTHIDDFSIARNKSFSMATSKYIMWLDTDDVIKPVVLKKLFELKEELKTSKYNSYVLKYNYGHDQFGNPNSDHLRHRIVKNDIANNRWEYPIHEIIVCRTEKFKKREDLYIDHERVHGYAGERNYRILKIAYDGRYKNDGRIVHYYARECSYLKKHQEVIDIYSKRIYEVPEYTRIGSYYYYAKSLFAVNDYSTAVKVCLEATNKAPQYAEFPFMLAEYYELKMDYGAACMWYNKALVMDKPKDTWEVFVDDNVYNHTLVQGKIDKIKGKVSIPHTDTYKLSINKPSVSKVINEKVGRNDPCPCGSGKKYKRCCGIVTSTKLVNSVKNRSETAFLLPLHDSDSSRKWLPEFMNSYINTEAIANASLYILCNGDVNWTAEVERTINSLYRNITNVYTIPCGSNLGFPKAINFGLKQFYNQNKKFDYIGFLNSDVSFSKNWLNKMIESVSKEGIAGTGFCARAYSLGGVQTIGWLEFSCVLFKSRALFNDSTIKLDSYGKIEDVICLDPVFGMGYFEDDSLCLDLLLKGWNLDIVREPLVYHHPHSSTPDFVKKISDNYKVFCDKYRNLNNPAVNEYLNEQYKFINERCPWIIDPSKGI